MRERETERDKERKKGRKRKKETTRRALLKGEEKRAREQRKSV